MNGNRTGIYIIVERKIKIRAINHEWVAMYILYIHSTNVITIQIYTNEWLDEFQEQVNKIAESHCLQFTAEAWNLKEDEEITNDKLTIVKDEHFPYLDMEMYWNERHELKFQVHMKPNQKLKYLNSNNIHMPSIS